MKTFHAYTNTTDIDNSFDDDDFDFPDGEDDYIDQQIMAEREERRERRIRKIKK